MKKSILPGILFFLIFQTNAQVQVAKLIGKNSNDYTYGYGGFLKFGYPLSAPSDVSLEIGALVYTLKSNSKYGWAMIPLKAGYRYVVTGNSAGPYVEPQVGYNIFGIDPADDEFTGFIWGIGTGYLFKPMGGIRFDLGLRYESIMYKGGSVNYIMLRLTHNFGIGRKQYDEGE